MAIIKDKIKKNNDKETAYKQLIGYGWTPEQATGILGNLVYESGLNTTVIGDKNLKDKAYGIAQFRGERFERLKKRHGNNWDKLENQIEYVNWELNNTEKRAGDLLRTTKMPMAAAQVISDAYERPKVKFYQDKNRQNAVENTYRQLVKSDYVYSGNKSVKEIGDEIRNTMNSISYTTQTEPQKETEKEEIKTEEPLKEEEVEVNEAVADLGYKQEVQNTIDLYKEIANTPYQEPIEEEQIDLYSDVNEQFNQAEQFVVNPLMKQGGVIEDNRGQLKYPGEITKINDPSISMKGVKQKLIGIADTGEVKVLMPELDYFFKGAKSVTEYPIR